MKLVIAKDTDQYFGSQLRELDFPVEIFPIDPEDASNPSWDSIPNCDAFFLSYQFLFAIRDNQKLFQPLSFRYRLASFSRIEKQRYLCG